MGGNFLTGATWLPGECEGETAVKITGDQVMGGNFLTGATWLPGECEGETALKIKLDYARIW